MGQANEEIEMEILDLLADDQPRCSDEIIEELMRQGHMVRQALKRLCHDGEVVRKQCRKKMLYMSPKASAHDDDKTAEQIVALLMTGPFSAKTVGHRLRIGEPKAFALLDDMADKGIISRNKTSRFTSYYVQVPEESEAPIVAPRYVPPFRELGIHDLATFKRLCEGARRNDKGMV